MRALWLPLVLVSFGCNKKPDSSGSSDAQVAEGVTIALQNLTGQSLPQVSWESMGQYQNVTSAGPATTLALPRSLFGAIEGSVTSEQWLTSQDTLRLDVISLKGNSGPVNTTIAGKPMLIPLSLGAEGKIEILRPYRSRAEASAAPMLPPSHLPFTPEAAQALPVGTYISLPFSGNVSFQIDGNFLSQNWSSARELAHLVSTSATGVLSGVAQAMVHASGNWKISVFKKDETHVRVRLEQELQSDARTSGRMGANLESRFVAIPLGFVDKVYDIKQKITSNAFLVNRKVSEFEADVKKRRLDLQGKIQLASYLLANIPGFNPEQREFLEAANRRVDDAVAVAERLESQMGSLRAATLDQYKTKAEELIAKASVPVDKATRVVEMFHTRTLRAAAAVELTGELQFGNRTLADFIVDLSSEEGRVAYQYMLSGRARWLGVRPGGDSNLVLCDFSVADRLASEDEARPQKRVERLLSGNARRSSHVASIHFSGLGGGVGFTQQNRLVTANINTNQGKVTFGATAWSFERNQSGAAGTATTRLASGLLLQNSQPDSYWFSWKNTKAGDGSLKKDLTETLNLTGSVGHAMGLATLFKGDAGWDRETSLLVVVKKRALERLFDPNQVSDALYWKTWGELAETFENQFGLPMNPLGELPVEWRGQPEAEKACASVTRNWGARYCGWFAQNVLARIQQLRANPSLTARVQFFEEFYKAGFLANRIGARLLVRYLLELQRASAPQSLLQDISIQFSSHTNSDDSEYASPTLTLGDSPELEMLRAMNITL